MTRQTSAKRKQTRRRRRRAATAPMIISREVPNPYFQPEHPAGPSNPRTIMAAVNTRESAIELLFSRGLIDDAQKRAADMFRHLYESIGNKISALDYSQDKVDGGKGDPITAKLTAAQELERCRVLLGIRGYDLVCRVCGEGRALGDLFSTNREKTTAADVLRAGLDDLGELWGLVRRKSERFGQIRSQRY